MNKIISFITGIVFMLSGYSCKKTIQPGEPTINTFEQLAELFKDPPAGYRTVPFWVWNDEVTRVKIDRDLENFKRLGFGGVFVHPRYGLITEYLSDEWFDLVKYSLDKGKELGLYVWIYDENSFPSGFGGGHVPAKMPESYNQGMALKLHKQEVLNPDTSVVWKYIFVKEEEEMKEITDDFSDYIGKTGDYYLYELLFYEQSKWYGGYSYVDLIYKGVTQKFIELTMDGYEKSIGADFGGWVPGVFTDEPNIAPGGERGVIRWTPDLNSVFLKQWGYDLRPHLISLVEDIRDWKKIRHDHYSTLLQMFIDRWSKPWYQYTEKMNLKWTGHYWEHGWPSPHHGGDNMAMYAWHQMPGIDMLFNAEAERPDQFGNARVVKELISVANQFDRRRTLSETYGASGWELTFEDMKRNGDWEYVLGVNFMNQHLSLMTLMGDRKHDFPQSFSYHAPYWDYYIYQADYFGRLSLALSSGEQINRILVIEPTSTMWMYYNPGRENEKMYRLGNQFEDFIDELEKYQIEYDLGCENIMKDQGFVEKGRMFINQRGYDLVVLPPGLENLDSPTAKLIGKYLEEGGKILSLIPPPEYIDGELNGELKDMFYVYQEQCYTTEGSLSPAEINLMAADEVQFLSPENINGKLFHHRRNMDDGQLIFLANSSMEESSVGRFRIKGENVIQMDPESGMITTYHFEHQDDFLYVSFEIPPVGSLLLFVSRKPVDVDIPVEAPLQWTVINGGGGVTVKPLQSNVLVLDYCYLTIGEEKHTEHYFYTASDKIFKNHGFDDNPWVSSSQYKTEILDRDTFSKDVSGFRVDFPFYIADNVDCSDFKAVVERPHLYDVLVNEQKVQSVQDKWWLDEAFGVIEIGEFLTAKENSISLIANPMSVHCELEPVFLLGDFNLEPSTKGWKIVPPEPIDLGAWNEQGWPFYHHSVDYSKTYSFDNKAKFCKVQLSNWSGTVAVVKVNGQEAGIIYRKPYELDISELVEEGKNNIEVRVIGSLKNLLGPHHNVTQRGIVTPWSFKYAPEIQPPGVEYDLLRYGLFEEFVLLEGK